MTQYRDRLIDQVLDRKLRSVGAVIIEGARGVGKSTTALHHAKSSISLDVGQAAEQATLAPESVLAGPVPRLIDEWRLAPKLWNSMRHEVDQRQAPGQFILTGSAAPTDQITYHSGAGRVARLTLQPMTLFESGDSFGQVSLAALMEGEGPAAFGGPSVSQYANLLVRGGWPGLIDRSPLDASDALRDYLSNIARVDLRQNGGSPDPMRVAELLWSLARNTSTEASLARLAADAKLDGDPLSVQTVRRYLDQLARVFVLEELPAWRTHVRSSVTLRVKPKWHMVDPALAAAALRATPTGLLEDLATFGLLFESMVVRDLRAYASIWDGQVYHFRDSSGLEIDAIIQRSDGRWLAVEAKLGGDAAMVQAASSFAKLKNRLASQTLAKCAGLVVVTAGNASHQRTDGNWQVALGHLGP